MCSTISLRPGTRARPMASCCNPQMMALPGLSMRPQRRPCGHRCEAEIARNLADRSPRRRTFMSRIIDLSLLIEDNMPAHKLFQRPVYAIHMTHESAKAHNIGVPGAHKKFQTNFIGMLDHVGTHVDAFRHVNPKGKSV